MARALGLTLVLLPVVAGATTALMATHVVAEPSRGGPRVLWWLSMFVASFAISAGTQRLCRRAVPLKSLLGMTLVFPDRAPSRLVTARLAGSTKALQQRVDEARAAGANDTPTRGAEQVLALVAMINRHDRRTRGHCERVRAFAELLGEELHLAPADRERLRWAALLHDLGKLTIDPAILNKPGAPTPQEWELLKTHPAAGGPIAEPLREWLGDWVLAVTQHHEKWDGSGYPLGLTGEDISRPGRIVAIADAFEVMTAIRSYKKAMPAAEARRELTRCSGTHFDPTLVRAFLNISLGDLRHAIGPFAWMAEFPALRALSRASNVVTVAGQTALVGGAALTAAVVGTAGATSAAGAQVASTANRRVAIEATSGRHPQTPGSPGHPSNGTQPGSHAGSTTTPTSSRGASTPRHDPTTAAPSSPTTGTTNPSLPTTQPASPGTPPPTTTPPTTTPPTNHAPVAVADARTGPKHKTININVLANDSDPDNNLDPLSVTIVSGPTGPGTQFGAVAVTANAGRDLVTYTEPDAAGVFTFVYRVCDTDGACSQATVSVTLT